MPLVILTALQVGKPIIASNFAGIAQAIQSGVNGILIDYRLESLSNNLCDTIEELYSDPVLRNNLSIAAKKSFLEYTPEKYGERISELYFHILNKNSEIER
jgi:glycosyltransferase involved in cell wall biosynthesis